MDLRIASRSKNGPFDVPLEPAAASFLNFVARGDGTSAWMEMRALPSARIVEATEAEQAGKSAVVANTATPRTPRFNFSNRVFAMSIITISLKVGYRNRRSAALSE